VLLFLYSYLLKRKPGLVTQELCNVLFEFVGMNTQPRVEVISNHLAARFGFSFRPLSWLCDC
jgi:hypothetical protein